MAEWSPLLVSHDLEHESREALTSICQAFVAKEYPLNDTWTHEQALLLYGYLGPAFNDSRWADRMFEFMSSLPSQSRENQRSLALNGGLCGWGWMVTHLTRRFDDPLDVAEESADGPAPAPDEPESTILRQIDSLVTLELCSEVPSRPLGLLHGVVGYGIYLLDRLPAAGAVETLQLIVNLLEATVEEVPEGCTWRTAPHVLPEAEQPQFPYGFYDLGAAEGVPGILYLLAELVAANLETAKAQALLENGMKWLAAKVLAPSSGSNEPEPIRCVKSSRLGWCSGDLGIASTMLGIGRLVARDDWRDTAYELLDRCLARSEITWGISDPSLCHGAAGIAHILNRLYQETHDARYRNAALGWYETLLQMRDPAASLGGFLMPQDSDQVDCPPWCIKPGFLDGTIGIALALLAALTPLEPRWDRLLLLSGKLQLENVSTQKLSGQPGFASRSATVIA